MSDNKPLLEESFIKRWKPEGEGGGWNGYLVSELSRDDLLALIGWFANETRCNSERAHANQMASINSMQYHGRDLGLWGRFFNWLYEGKK